MYYPSENKKIFSFYSFFLQEGLFYFIFCLKRSLNKSKHFNFCLFHTLRCAGNPFLLVNSICFILSSTTEIEKKITAAEAFKTVKVVVCANITRLDFYVISRHAIDRQCHILTPCKLCKINESSHLQSASWRSYINI